MKAIRWAVNKKVHIISMSWTIADSPDGSEPGTGSIHGTAKDLEDLKQAIAEARKHNILMFGASNEEGGVNSTAGAMNPPLPGKCDGVLCIGAADDYVKAGAGKIEDFFFPGTTEGMNFLHYGKAKSKEKLVFQNGSSVATALAAGFTALILQCLEISKYGRSPAGERYRSTLQNYQELQKIFKDRGEDGKFITVPPFFSPKIFGSNDCFWMDTGKADLDKAVHEIIKYESSRPYWVLLLYSVLMLRRNYIRSEDIGIDRD